MNRTICVKSWSKGKKAHVITDDGGHKYYLKKGVNCYKDKIYDIEYEESSFTTDDNKTMKLLWIGKATETKEQLGKQDVSPKGENTVSNETQPDLPAMPSAHKPEPTNWNVRNRQTDRGMIISYVCEHLVSKGLIKVEEIDDMVERLFNIQYEIKQAEAKVETPKAKEVELPANIKTLGEAANKVLGKLGTEVYELKTEIGKLVAGYGLQKYVSANASIIDESEPDYTKWDVGSIASLKRLLRLVKNEAERVGNLTGE